MVWGMVGLMVLLQLGFTYLPALQTLFGTSGLSLVGWSWCLVTAVATCAVVEVDKIVRRTILRKHR
ncbi:hypothetical protein D3C84_1295600 [compost metagenome]